MNLKINIYLCLAIFIGKIFLDAILFKGFTVDSWTYYDLSKQIFSGYEPSFIRQYQYNSLHSPSFPFFYPLLIHFIDTILNIGIYSSLVLNILILIACCIVSGAILKKLNLNQERLIIISFILLYPPFFQEVAYGRSIPLATLEILLISYIFISQQYLSAKQLFTLGLIFSVSILTRFEFLISFIIFTLWVLFKEKKLIGKILFLVPPLISIVIWVTYSERYFNTLWITESSKLVLMPPQFGALDYVPSIENNSFLSLITNIIIKEIKTFTSFILWGALTPTFIILAHLIYKYISHKKNRLITLKGYIGTKLIFLIVTISSVVPIVGLTGYTDGRYFFNLYLLITLFLLYTTPAIYSKHKITTLCLIYTIIISSAWTIGRTVKKSISIDSSQEYITLIDKDNIRQCVEKHNLERILFITENGFEQVSVSEDAITGTALYFLSPTNIDKNNINSFIHDYNIDAIYSKNSILTDLPTIQCTSKLHIIKK